MANNDGYVTRSGRISRRLIPYCFNYKYRKTNCNMTSAEQSAEIQRTVAETRVQQEYLNRQREEMRREWQQIEAHQNAAPQSTKCSIDAPPSSDSKLKSPGFKTTSVLARSSNQLFSRAILSTKLIASLVTSNLYH